MKHGSDYIPAISLHSSIMNADDSICYVTDFAQPEIVLNTAHKSRHHDQVLAVQKPQRTRFARRHQRDTDDAIAQ